MRLYLSSYRLGDDEEAMTRLVPLGSRVAVSANALDNQPAAVRDKIVSMERALLTGLGYVVDELDLRGFFDRDDIAARLRSIDLVWATGGNSFVLALAMKLSGFDTALRAQLFRLAYGGYSAGAVVAGSTLHGVEHADAIDDFPADYPSREVVWDGMKLVDYAVAPHWESDPSIPKMVAELEQRGLPYRALRDGETIIVSS